MKTAMYAAIAIATLVLAVAVMMVAIQVKHTLNDLPATVDAVILREMDKTRDMLQDELKSTRDVVSSELGSTRETVLEAEALAKEAFLEAEENILKRVDTAVPEIVSVADQHLGVISSSAQRLLDEYADIPRGVKAELSVLKPYMDCENNDLCWPKQANELMFASRMMTRDVTLTMNSARRDLFPQLISTTNTLAKTAEVEIPRFTGSVNGIAENVNRWTRPAWWKEAITWGGRAAIPAASMWTAFGKQKVEVSFEQPPTR
jgi:hypothetical protein